MSIFLTPILLPLVFALALLFMGKVRNGVREAVAALGAAANFALAVSLFGKEASFSAPWAGFGMDLSFKLYTFNSFIVLAAAFFTLAIVIYALSFLSDKFQPHKFYFFLFLSTAMVNGAVLADNLIVMLFFWEGLLIPLYGMITLGGGNAWKTAVKAFIIVGISDLCMMFGIALAGHIAGTLNISQMHIQLGQYANIAFILLMIGAIAKAGSMPFHSWIPDAAVDAPLPFMSFMPAALEKLLGIYFLAKISLDMFALTPDSRLTTLLMIIGVVTILFAVMMALIQKDFKRLLSYHAISQVGYMILGIGTGVPAGIVGGLFHMINHAMYKSCLFLTGGAVEKQAGTTDLKKLGGIGVKMPFTFACFIIAAAAISGVPPLNGFFSKELVYDGALERGWFFYAAALAGSFFTAASFLKLGHSAFMGKLSKENENVKEAPILMLIPMMAIATVCIFFGLFNKIPLSNFIVPALGARAEGHVFGGFHVSIMLVAFTLIVLVAALLNHLYGVKKSGNALGAADHIHHSPMLSNIYDEAERPESDPYDAGLKTAGIIAKGLYYTDKAIDWCYNVLTVRLSYVVSNISTMIHDGNYSSYLIWSVVASAAVVLMLIR